MRKFQRITKTSKYIMRKNLNTTIFAISNFRIVCIIKKKITIYKKYKRNSDENDFNLCADYIQNKIVIIFTINSNCCKS